MAEAPAQSATDTCMSLRDTEHPICTTPSTTSSSAQIWDDGLGRPLSKRARLILHLQFKGLRQREIANLLGMNENRISVIVNSARYKRAYDGKLNEVDDEFLRMKPMAIRAVESGLTCGDERISLRAAETWFKAHGYGGFGEGRGVNVTVNVTAEDVALQLFSGAAERKALAQNAREAGGLPTGSVGLRQDTAPPASPDTSAHATQGQGESPP
jgi:hypothetical protein